MRISYSNIDLYDRCPYIFKYIVIDKHRMPKTKEAVLGTAVHHALKYMFSRSPLYPTIDQIIDNYRKRWEELSRTIAKKNDEENKETEILQQNGIEMLTRFYRKNPPWNYNVLDLESRFEIPIRDKTTGKEHTLSGIIDRIDKIDDDTFEIIDYKTTRRMPPQEKVDNNLQLSLYNLGLQKRWPHLASKKIKLSLYFLQHNEKIETKRTSEDINNTEKVVISKINEIEESIKNNYWPAKPSPLCALYPYNRICPMWSHLYRQKTETGVDTTEQEADAALHEYLTLKSQNQNNAARIKELQMTLLAYMKTKNFDRLFSEEGYVARNIRTTAFYDIEKVRLALEPIGKWHELLKVDEKRIEKILPSLPSSTQQAIKKAILRVKETESLVMRRKKISNSL